MTKKRFNLRNVVKIGVTCLAVCMTFAACKKENDSSGNGENNSNINPSVIEVNGLGGSNIATVKMMVYWENEYEGGEDAIATAPYQNGGFKMTLPATIPDKYLWEWGEGEKGITVSDPNARVCALEGVTAYSSAEKSPVGYFYSYLRGGDVVYGACYRIYSDRDFSIRGKYSRDWGNYSEEWECFFKKGWNILYYYDKGNSEIYTTQKPSNAEIKWIYSPSNNPVVRFKKENSNTNCWVIGIKYYYDDDYGYVEPRHYFSESLLSEYYKIYGWGIGVYDIVYYDDYYYEVTAISNYNFVANKAYTVLCSDDGFGNPVISVVEDGQKSSSSDGHQKVTMKMMKRR